MVAAAPVRKVAVRGRFMTVPLFVGVLDFECRVADVEEPFAFVRVNSATGRDMPESSTADPEWFELAQTRLLDDSRRAG